MPQAETRDPADAAEAFWRCRQVVLDTWQRSRTAGFLYVFGWVVVAWLGGVHRHAPVMVAVGAAGFLVAALARWRLRPPPAADMPGHARWLQRYAVALTLAPALWAVLQAWLLLDPRFGIDAVMVSMIATIGYATVIANVYTTMPRTAAVGAVVLFVPMLAVLWLDPAHRPLALAGSLYGVYLAGALPRSAGEYRRRLDLDGELRRQRDLYSRLSRTDPLTGLANRREFTGRLARLSAAGGGDFTLLILDIDHFKRVNDRHGHAIGDACLRALVPRLQAAFAGADTLIARLGGEEFGVLAATAQAAALAENFRTALAALPLQCDGVAVPLTVSIGVGRFDPAVHGDGDGLYRAVDRALYAAKAAGRDRICEAEASGRAPLESPSARTQKNQ